ncbi:MAG: GspH/FimT family protein, partial [Cellvibrio sp.]
NGIRDGDEKTLQQHEKLAGVQVTANKPVKSYISYIGSGESRNATGTSGGGFQAGTITICPTEKGTGYELILARGGRVRMNEIKTQDCEAQE